MIDLRILGLAAAMAVLGASGCASTGDGTMEMAEGEGDPSEVVCRRIHEVGSRVASRECKTRAEWDREADEARDAMRRNDQNQSVQPFPVGPS